MFNKTPLALAFATLICAPSIYAIVSVGTPPVVGFKPVFTNKTGKGSIKGALYLDSSVSVNTKDIANILGFSDRDGDKPDEVNFKYSWTVEDKVLSTTTTVTLPNSMELVGKPLVLTITPVSISGEPIIGVPLVLDNLNEAGAKGGDGKGNIGLRPINVIADVSKVKLAGALEVGKELTASYKFTPYYSVGLDEERVPEEDFSYILTLIEDHSIFVWGTTKKSYLNSLNKYVDKTTIDSASELAATGVSPTNPNVIQVSGQVPQYTITKDDVGEVLELSIYPRMNLINGDITYKNKKWILAGPALSRVRTIKTTDINQIDGLINPNKDGKVAWASVEPKVVKINFTSSATTAVNGIDGVRPVAAKDVLKATFTPAANASPNASDYTFQWMAAGNKIGTAEVGKDTFTPGPQYQGKPIWVDVLPAKKAVP
ncbi:TPA: hypothetical protein ACSP1O_004033 [Aeromonas veronii]|uniref:hypothetical protein n=1 Tax=Aeromonas veronii TaxID=654 RepID=UPI0038D61D6C